MTDDRTFDRRSLLRRASAAGLLGLPGVGSLRARQDGNGDGEQDGDGEEGPIDYFQAVLPAGEILEANLVYRIVVVGGQIRPGERPPPLCFPESEQQWRARSALVVKPTETTGIFGSDDDIGAVNRTRAHLEKPVEPGSVYRISGGEYCDGHALVTIHELPPRLSEHFSTDMRRTIEEFVANQTSDDATVGNGTLENGTLGNETVGNGTLGNGTVGNESLDNESVGNGTAEDSTAGDTS